MRFKWSVFIALDDALHEKMNSIILDHWRGAVDLSGDGSYRGVQNWVSREFASTNNRDYYTTAASNTSIGGKQWNIYSLYLSDDSPDEWIDALRNEYVDSIRVVAVYDYDTGYLADGYAESLNADEYMGLTGPDWKPMLLIFGQEYFKDKSKTRERTVAKIRALANEKRTDAYNPLPLCSSLNSRNFQWGGDFQRREITRGVPYLPTMNGFSFLKEALDYKEVEFLQYISDNNLPVALKQRNFGQEFITVEKYNTLPDESYPLQLTADGIRSLEVTSPYGLPETWAELGVDYAINNLSTQFQQIYPNPNKVIFTVNNETHLLLWTELDNELRYLDEHGFGRSDDYKVEVIRDRWKLLHNALRTSWLENMPQSWADKSTFIGFRTLDLPNAFQSESWREGSFYSNGRAAPTDEMHYWDGTFSNLYENYNNFTDIQAKSRTVCAFNSRWELDNHTYRENPDFWTEAIIWEGGDALRPPSYTPAHYSGFAKYVMWVLRPRVVREFRRFAMEREDFIDYWNVIANSVVQVHEDETLAEMWERGTLITNTSRQHVFNTAVPTQYEDAERWYALECSSNEKGPWAPTTPVHVWAIAVKRTVEQDTKWLVYAYAPRGDVFNEVITVPGYGDIVVDVPLSGVYTLINITVTTIETQ